MWNGWSGKVQNETLLKNWMMTDVHFWLFQNLLNNIKTASSTNAVVDALGQLITASIRQGDLFSRAVASVSTICNIISSRRFMVVRSIVLIVKCSIYFIVERTKIWLQIRWLCPHQTEYMLQKCSKIRCSRATFTFLCMKLLARLCELAALPVHLLSEITS